MFSPLNLIAAAVSVALLLGGYFTGRDVGRTACALERANERLQLLDDWQTQVLDEIERADDLSRKLATAEKRTRTVYQEVIREIPSATLGRPCLGPDALGLLDRFPGLAPAGLPETSGEPVDPGGAVATDTQIAGWIAAAWKQHERERAGCNALIEWHAK